MVLAVVDLLMSVSIEVAVDDVLSLVAVVGVATVVELLGIVVVAVVEIGAGDEPGLATLLVVEGSSQVQRRHPLESTGRRPS